MRKSKYSIRWHLFGYLTLFSGVLILVLWLFQVVFLEDFYKSIKVKEIQATGERIASNISNNEIEDFIETLATRKDISVTLASEDGMVIYNVGKITENPVSNSYTVEEYCWFAKKAEEKGGVAIYYMNPLKKTERPSSSSGGSFSSNKLYYKPTPLNSAHRQDNLIYTSIIKENGQSYLLMINGSIMPVDATVSTLRVQLIYVTAILVVLAFILALIIARRIGKPIIELNESAKNLAVDCENAQFAAKGYKEIAELSETLNYAADELAKTEKLRQELIANVSHDLRTPLTLISGYAEVMRDLPGENNPENNQVIIDEAKRLTQLVNDLLDLSKLQAGTMALEKDIFNLTQHIEEMLQRYTILTEQKGYKIYFVKQESVDVEADELKISQVIYNLINNAINYTGDNKEVMVRQLVKDGKVRIEICDTGEGIKKEDLPYIWDRYYKVDKAHKRAMVGTGLGLSIVQKILEQHKADYGVESEVGVGTTFWFELPCIEK